MLDNVALKAEVELPSCKDIRIEGLYNIELCVYHVVLRILSLDIGPTLAAESQARVGIVMVFIHQGYETNTSPKPVNSCTSMGYDILRLDDDTSISCASPPLSSSISFKVTRICTRSGPTPSSEQSLQWCLLHKR